MTKRLAVLIPFLLLWGACSFVADERVGPPLFPPRVAHENLKLAMRYHGIRTCTIDESGTWFERDGKRCRVWTGGCREYVKKRGTRKTEEGGVNFF